MIPEGAGLDAVSAVMFVLVLGWVAWSARMILREKYLRLPELSVPDEQRIEPYVFIFSGVSVWFAGMFVGAVFYLIFYGPDETADTLGSTALLGVASQVGSVLAALGIFLALPPLAARATGIGAFFEKPALRMGAFAFAIVCPIALLAAFGAQQAAHLVSELLGSEPPQRLAHGTLRQIADPEMMRHVGWWLTILVVTIGAPITEEIVFRGFLQTGLARATRSHGLGILVSTVLFVLVHVGIADWQAMLPLAALSLGMGYAYARTGTIWVPIVVHALFNLLNIVMAMGA